MKIFTIGYEGTTMADFLAALTTAGVERVIDVRALPLSRRPGFSKATLAASLAEVGIGYVHLKALGTPKPGRDAARKGRVAEMHAIFNDHMAEPAAQLELAKATEFARTKKTALLCYEAEHADCHRAILADRIRETLGCEIEPL